MKKNIIIFLLLALLPGLVKAQLAKKILNKVKSTAETRAINKSVSETEKALDEIEGKGKTATLNNEVKQSAIPASEKMEDLSSEKKESYKQASDTTLTLYTKYDFLPGEKLIYYNDFASEAMGELPIGWNSNGTAAVTTITGKNGKWVQLKQNSIYLTDNKESFSENFTVEFDLILHRSNPKAAFPMMTFGVVASGTYNPGANELLKAYSGEFSTELKIQPYDNSGSYLHLQTFLQRSKHLSTDIKKWNELPQYFNKVIHVAMQVQHERLRIWFNETKMYDLPKAVDTKSIINQLYFDVKRYGGPDSEVGYAVSNIKIAKGIPDTRHKLVEEGIFSTTGVLFDVNAAKIKPESNGVLKEISEVMKTNAGIKVRIIGHTDSEGSDIANLELSKKRAEAVKQALIKNFEIDESSLETDGKGETIPVGDNNTKEGKAQNRRVEFIKL